MTLNRLNTLLLALLCSLVSFAEAQTYLYRGRSSYSGDILYSWDGRYMYQGRSSYSGDILYTFDGRYVYQGRSTYSGDILLTISDGHVYRGRSTYSGDILYSFDGLIPLPILLMMMH